jgi:ribosomal protein S18 acetylase RimI-like enzyme
VEIKNLASTDIETIIGCLSQSFADYFVPMSSDIAYWRNRFKISRIDLQFSYGCFVENNLVGFMLIAIDQHEGTMTAYNGGTGVIPEYRGRKIVDQLYEFAIPIFKEQGIERCTLEVIEQNDRAVKVYERIGFEKTKFLRCFKGYLKHGDDVQLKETELNEINHWAIQENQLPAWDHSLAALKQAGSLYKVFEVFNPGGKKLGFFVINPENGYIPQSGLFPGISGREKWDELMSSISKISTSVKMNNVDDRRKDLIAALERSGLENFINQFEMELCI